MAKKIVTDASPLKGVVLKTYMKLLKKGWKVIRGHHIEKEFSFKDFDQALAFTNKIGAIANKLDHHPDIALSWGKVKVTLWTHSVGGLSEKDFLLAEMCDTVKL